MFAKHLANFVINSRFICKLRYLLDIKFYNFIVRLLFSVTVVEHKSKIYKQPLTTFSHKPHKTVNFRNPLKKINVKLCLCLSVTITIDTIICKHTVSTFALLVYNLVY